MCVEEQSLLSAVEIMSTICGVLQRGPTTGDVCVEALWRAREGRQTLPADIRIHFLNAALDKYKPFMGLDSAQGSQFEFPDIIWLVLGLHQMYNDLELWSSTEQMIYSDGRNDRKSLWLASKSKSSSLSPKAMPKV